MSSVYYSFENLKKTKISLPAIYSFLTSSQDEQDVKYLELGNGDIIYLNPPLEGGDPGYVMLWLGRNGIISEVRAYEEVYLKNEDEIPEDFLSDYEFVKVKIFEGFYTQNYEPFKEMPYYRTAGLIQISKTKN